MTKMHALVNEDGGMWRYTPGDRLSYVGAFEVRTSEGGVHTDLEALWSIANRYGADVNDKIWPSTVRSMCTGDVVLVERAGGFDAYVVTSFGFDRMEPADVIKSLVESRAEGVTL